MTDAERHRTTLREMRDLCDKELVFRHVPDVYDYWQRQKDALDWALRAQEEARGMERKDPGLINRLLLEIQRLTPTSGADRFQAAQSCNGPTVYYDPGDGDLQPIWGWDSDDPAGEQWAHDLSARLNAVVVVPAAPTGAEQEVVTEVTCPGCERKLAIGTLRLRQSALALAVWSLSEAPLRAAQEPTEGRRT